jgi:hypothetical protein
MLRWRAATALVLAPVALAAIALGKWAILLVLLVVIAGAAYELSRALDPFPSWPPSAREPSRSSSPPHPRRRRPHPASRRGALDLRLRRLLRGTLLRSPPPLPEPEPENQGPPTAAIPEACNHPIFSIFSLRRRPLKAGEFSGSSSVSSRNHLPRFLATNATIMYNMLH